MRATKHGTLTNRGPSTQRAQDIKTSRPLLIIIVLTLWAGTHIFMRHGAKIFSIGVYPENTRVVSCIHCDPPAFREAVREPRRFWFLRGLTRPLNPAGVRWLFAHSTQGEYAFSSSMMEILICIKVSS